MTSSRERVREDGQRSKFAANVIESIIRMAERLLEFSQLGHAGRVERTREVILTPYVIVYRIHESNVINVEAVIHGAQRF
jgi:plasmid stabilization system protein ParE